MTNEKRSVILNSGSSMPMLGFGTSLIPNETLPKIVSDAISCGFRLIDTASAYDNEKEVGAGIRMSGVPRSELFLTTKLKFWHHKSEEAIAECHKSLKRLNTDYIDLFLIHWPVLDNEEAWAAMEKLVRDGCVRNIGVCNYHSQHLMQFEAPGVTLPAVDQLEVTPRLHQDKMLSECEEHGILLQAWSPLMAGKAFRIPELQQIAEKHGVSIPKMVLGWLLSRGISVISRSTSVGHMEDTLTSFDFVPDAEDLAVLAALNDGTRMGPNPDTFAGEAVEHFDELLALEREKEANGL